MQTEFSSDLRKAYDVLIASTRDPERIARLELQREYFTNDAFRHALRDYMWERSQRQ